MPDLTAVEVENARLQDLLRQAGVDSETSVVAARLQSILIGELHHRVKNTLAIVSAIVSQSLRTADDLDAATTSITHRLQALGTAHDLLLREGWSTASLRSLVATAIEAFQTGDIARFDLEGPNVSVSSGAALAISMVLHELCTNAIKYGALSVPDGRVKIAWAVDDATDRFRLTWSESGGPTVIAPRRPSFGSRLIERSLPGQLAGEARLRFEPTGVVCEVNIPLSSLREVSPERP